MEQLTEHTLLAGMNGSTSNSSASHPHLCTLLLSTHMSVHMSILMSTHTPAHINQRRPSTPVCMYVCFFARVPLMCCMLRVVRCMFAACVVRYIPIVIIIIMIIILWCDISQCALHACCKYAAGCMALGNTQHTYYMQDRACDLLATYMQRACHVHHVVWMQHAPCMQPTCSKHATYMQHTSL